MAAISVSYSIFYFQFTAKENTEQKKLENLNLQKQIITLDDVIPMKKKLVEDLTQEYVNLCATVDDTRCRQFRARVVSSHEAANRNKYLSSMEECKMTVDLTAGAKAKQLRDLSRRKSGLETKIRSLLDELQQKQKQAEDKEKELEGLQQKIFMLKKRNEARLVRLKKQVEKAEARQQALLKHQHVNK
ncbi:uncharacterized protein LOC134532631 isoform X2 [Bacillus rossius redtenbacheri]|uniref:uncharacterized protein LOC134532631 isoform X2 n=1 Tax=Bacillus rossius redtenbacheri TaxID=93214 RepID=UPI002FDD3F13